jgi:phosphatidylglycerophosphate synthase
VFDARLVPLQRRFLAPAARARHGAGIGADTVTIAGFLVGVLVVPTLALGLHGLALAFFAVNRLADGLDGEIARIDGPTDRGAFLDISLDFIVYALFPLGFALSDPAANALPAAVLIATFVGTGSSFLAFSVIAAKRGINSDAYPTKGIYYLGGLTEGTETIAVFVAMCLWPGAFAALAWVYAAACAVTTVVRWIAGWRMFGDG